ncbi:MAG: hypothetical protein JWQ38_2170, partial [Flavipsychrobacter sp.]|nr:hypothetical protein [Flavipsychrobacter sp.]
MKKILSFLLAISVATIATAQTKADYETAMKKYRQFYNNNETDSAFNLLSEKIKGMMSLDKTKEMMAKLNEEFGKLESYHFTKQDEHFTYYKTVFSKKTLTLVLLLNNENKLENFRFIPYTGDSSASNMRLKTATGTIYGTLLMPVTSNKKTPVVLIIAGSGPTDRDGNNPMGVKASSYKMLAEALQKEGIATVRYDKRGIGESV